MTTVIYQTLRCQGCRAPIQYREGGESYWRRCGSCGEMNQVKQGSPPEGLRPDGRGAANHQSAAILRWTDPSEGTDLEARSQEVLRLRQTGMGVGKIARLVRASDRTVTKILRGQGEEVA